MTHHSLAYRTTDVALVPTNMFSHFFFPLYFVKQTKKKLNRRNPLSSIPPSIRLHHSSLSSGKVLNQLPENVFALQVVDVDPPCRRRHLITPCCCWKRRRSAGIPPSPPWWRRPPGRRRRRPGSVGQPAGSAS